MFRIFHTLIVDTFRHFIHTRNGSTIGNQPPINHLVVKIVNNLTVFIPTGEVVLTDSFTAKLPLAFVHYGLKKVLFIGERGYISIYLFCMKRRVERTAPHTFQSFLSIITRAIKFVYGFGIHQQYICKAHTYIVNSRIGTAGSTQRSLHIEFGPFGGAHTCNSHVIFLIEIFVVFVRYASHVTAQIIFIE